MSGRLSDGRRNRLPYLLALSAGAVFAATPSDCLLLRHHGKTVEAQKCFESLTQSRDAYTRAEGYWGLENFQNANNEFRDAAAQADSNANIRVRWGRLMHDGLNNTEAVNLFNEALERDPKNAQAYMGLAIVSADGFDGKTGNYLDKALALDPKLAEAHELRATIALEDYNNEIALKEADAALADDPEALDAMAIHAAIEVLALRSPDAWLQKMLAVNPVYGQGFSIIAYQLVINRRYEEANTYYRKALLLAPRLWPAHSQLGVSLMRLGGDAEAREQLQLAYDNGYRDAATVNSLRLLDTYKNFVSFKGETNPADPKTDVFTVLKLNQKEADLLRPYFEDVMNRSITGYEAKYQMTLPAPVQVEVYNNHEDFAVRTMGMPGLGALGVTFGEVIAMDSPSGRPPGEFHWASTLWHEMDHAFVLTATHHLAPRWFAEGLAVHEETQASPEWGDRMTPEILYAIAGKKLLPVGDLDRGFVHPEYATQVIVSYFQAGRICDYIHDKWGDAKLLEMIHAYSEPTTTAAVFEKTLGMTTEAFDKEFNEWLMKDVGKTAANVQEWVSGLKALVQSEKDKNYDQVLAMGEKVRQMYPEYVYEGSAYEELAQAHLAKNDKPAAVEVLTAYEKLGGRNPAALKQLAGLEEEMGKPQDAAATLDRINYIDPVDEDLHRHLGKLWLDGKNYPGAIREYGALVAMHPLDRAGAEYGLAEAYFGAGDMDKAQDHVLSALEAAHGYRPALELLVKITDGKDKK
jgi:cellulose synthase operon protein C